MLVDDKEYELDSLAMLLEAEGMSVARFSSGHDALAHLQRETIDVVVTDLQMPAMDGIELTQKAKDFYPDLEVILVTAFGSIESAVEAMRLGASHYIVKGPNLGDELLLTLGKIAEKVGLRRHIEALEGEVEDEQRLAGIVGSSPEMKEVFRLVRTVAPHDTTVLIRGETGTGKGLLAHAIHSVSARSHEPFVTVDCAALPETLLESELFGHVKGAFTGAMKDREGKAKAAGKGTVCLDEIGDLPLSSQPKLLRLLEEKIYSPVGSNKELPSDARVVACTNRALEEMVEEGGFRLDLYHRLNVVTILLPALRHRRSDIPMLVNLLIRRVARRLSIAPKRVHPDAMAALLRYPWPGNVRQLVHAIERAIVIGTDDEIGMRDLPPEVIDGKASGPPSALGDQTDSLPENERRLVVRVLSETGWNIHEASRRLEVSRPTLYSKIKKFNISKDD